MTGMVCVKHSNLTLENCVIGPQIWMFDGHVNELKENPHYYKSIIAPSQWVKDLYVSKFGYQMKRFLYGLLELNYLM